MSGIETQTRIFEITAVIMTGVCKFIFVDFLPYKFWFISVAIGFWVVYVIVRTKKDPGLFKYWGFRKDNFGKVFKIIFPYAIGCVLLFGIYGMYFDTLILNWHIIVIMMIYPIWGVIQQFLIVSLIAGNLKDFKMKKNKDFPKILIVIITAFIFAIVHFPSILLVIGTFILAIFYTLIFLKEQNIWVLGIFHGWLGCLFYFFVLHRDPFMEVFSTI